MTVDEVIKLAKEYEALKRAQEDVKEFLSGLYGYEDIYISTDDEYFNGTKIHEDYKEEFTDFLKGYSYELDKRMKEVAKKVVKGVSI